MKGSFYIRRLLPPVLGILLLFACLYAGCFALVDRHYRGKMNREMDAFAQAVRRKAPEVTEEDIIRILQGKEIEEGAAPEREGGALEREIGALERESGALEREGAAPEREGDAAESEDRPFGNTQKGELSLWEKYGYTGNVFFSRTQEQFSRSVLAAAMAVSILLVLSFVFLLLKESRRRSEKAEELIEYFHGLESRAYDLRLEENSEDELSRLTNEVYKTAVVLKEAAEKSREESRMLTTALEDISHQIKTPLTSLQIMLDNCLEDPDMPPDIRQEFFTSMETQLGIISSLVITLLHLARFDAGVVQLHPAAFPVNDMLETIRAELGALCRERGVRIQLAGKDKGVLPEGAREAGTGWNEPDGLHEDARKAGEDRNEPGDLPEEEGLAKTVETMLTADRRWQQEAVKNLVKNAVEHSPEGSTVRVEVEDANLFVKITVRDEGEGISEKDLPHIFERFYKAENSSPDSIGIGLAFAKTVVERENGFITADSEPGKGSTFTVRYRKG